MRNHVVPCSLTDTVQVLFLGLSCSVGDGDSPAEIGFATHDGVYSNDFSIWQLPGFDIKSDNGGSDLADHLVREIQKYREKHLCKFLGAGITQKLYDISPALPAKLWLELDIVALVFRQDSPTHFNLRNRPPAMSVDEQADAVARQAVT